MNDKFVCLNANRKKLSIKRLNPDNMLEQSFSNSSYFFPRLPGNKLVAVNPNRKTKKQQTQQQKLRHSNEMLTTNEAISEEFLDNSNELYKSEMDFKGYSINLLNQKAHDMEMMEMSKISHSLSFD